MLPDSTFAEDFESYIVYNSSLYSGDSTYDYFSLKQTDKDESSADDSGAGFYLSDFCDTPHHIEEEYLNTKTALETFITPPYYAKAPHSDYFVPFDSPHGDVITNSTSLSTQQFIQEQHNQNFIENIGPSSVSLQQIQSPSLPLSSLDEQYTTDIKPLQSSQEVLKPATPASFINMHPNPLAKVALPQNNLSQTPGELDSRDNKRKRLMKNEIMPYPSIPPSPLFSPRINFDRRRSAHKAAEQKRRDTLKQNFDALRDEIVGVLLADKDEPSGKDRKEAEKEVKAMSKVLIVQHTYEYILQLKEETYTKDEKIRKMQTELESLRQKANN